MAYWVLKVILTPIFYGGWSVRAEGRAHVPRHGPAILAANHQSFCDSFFIPLVLKRKVTFLAKAEYFDSWKTAWFFRAAGQIPIRREGGDASERALATAREVLGNGHLLALYPEGTRTMDEFVHRGRTGAARLAVECGVPLIPVGVQGTVDVQPVGQRFMRPFRTVHVRFGSPLALETQSDVDGAEDTDPARRLTDRLMREIARLAGRTYVDEYIPRKPSRPERHARTSGGWRSLRSSRVPAGRDLDD